MEFILAEFIRDCYRIVTICLAGPLIWFGKKHFVNGDEFQIRREQANTD